MSVELVNEKNVQDKIRDTLSRTEDEVLKTLKTIPGDPRWMAIAITQIELGFMAAKRSLYEGKRVGD